MSRIPSSARRRAPASAAAAPAACREPPPADETRNSKHGVGGAEATNLPNKVLDQVGGARVCQSSATSDGNDTGAPHDDRSLQARALCVPGLVMGC